MADEISYQIALRCTKGYESESATPTSLVADKATIGAMGETQIVPTSDTVVDLGDLVAARWCYLRNLDTTNYIELGPTSGGAIVKMVKLKAGEACLFPLAASVVLRAIANTGSVNLKKLILET